LALTYSVLQNARELGEEQITRFSICKDLIPNQEEKFDPAEGDQGLLVPSREAPNMAINMAKWPCRPDREKPGKNPQDGQMAKAARGGPGVGGRAIQSGREIGEEQFGTFFRTA
jgi:hypothetical protein